MTAVTSVNITNTDWLDGKMAQKQPKRPHETNVFLTNDLTECWDSGTTVDSKIIRTLAIIRSLRTHALYSFME